MAEQQGLTFKGPSDKWFRKFISRHANPEAQDRSRGRISNPKEMQQYFGLLQDTIDKLGVSLTKSSAVMKQAGAEKRNPGKR